MKRWIPSLFLALTSVLLVLFVSCSSGVKRGSDDPSVNEKAMSRRLDLKDVDHALGTLMKEFEQSPFLGEVKRKGDRPTIAVDMIVNETDQHISTERLLQSFETLVVNLGSFKVVSHENVDKFKKYMLEQNSEWYNGATVPNAGNLFGFRYIIGGKIFGETERLSGEARTQYRLVLRAMNLETGVIEWQGQADITKFQY